MYNHQSETSPNLDAVRRHSRSCFHRRNCDCFLVAFSVAHARSGVTWSGKKYENIIIYMFNGKQKTMSYIGFQDLIWMAFHTIASHPGKQSAWWCCGWSSRSISPSRCAHDPFSRLDCGIVLVADPLRYAISCPANSPSSPVNLREERYGMNHSKSLLSYPVAKLSAAVAVAMQPATTLVA